jgi:hypothetical protein
MLMELQKYKFQFKYLCLKIKWFFLFFLGRDSSVGIATRYGLEGPGI